MSRAVNYRELKHIYETMGPAQTCRHLREALANNHLRPEDFSLRDLAEATIPDGAEFVRLSDPRSKSGGIDLLEAANVVDTATFSNITGQIIFSKIMEGFTSEAFVASRMVETIPTRFSGEKIPGIGQMGDVAEAINEGRVYPHVGLSEDYIETPATTKRGLIVPVTKEGHCPLKTTRPARPLESGRPRANLGEWTPSKSFASKPPISGTRLSGRRGPSSARPKSESTPCVGRSAHRPKNRPRSNFAASPI